VEIDDEEFGGTCVTLVAGDRLKAVPRSHRRLVTPEIEAWWADPMAEVRRVGDRAASPRMAEWFHAMAERGTWRLRLHRADHGGTQAGYDLSCPNLRRAEVGPPQPRARFDQLPDDLAAFYRLVGFMDWMGFGAAGGFGSASGHIPLSAFGFAYHGAVIDPAETFAFGWAPGGDMLIYASDGRGGWLCHENGKIHLLGSVLDTIDWVFGELLADRCPDFDYSWA
jgi:hypothetical protein